MILGVEFNSLRISAFLFAYGGGKVPNPSDGQRYARKHVGDAKRSINRTVFPQLGIRCPP